MRPIETMDRREIETHQLQRLRDLIAELRKTNAYYGAVLREAGVDENIGSLDAFIRAVPVTTKQQVLDDQCDHPLYGSNLTYPLDHYTRLHRTSGTTGQPMRWLDTPESWQRMLDNWKRVFQTAGVTAEDRAFFAFSFGPFIGFWAAFEAGTQLGMLCIPGGGMGSEARLRILLDNEATVLCCTPTYALRLAEVAEAEGIELDRSRVRRILVGGEPGGSVPEVRRRIESRWPGARVVDHHGMTEVGPVSFENDRHRGVLHVIEQSYLAEVVDPHTLAPTPPGEDGELLLTTLDRVGMPLLRYRTGDIVKRSARSAADLGYAELAMEGGIRGRSDEMIVIRGNNVFPSAVEAIIRRHDGVSEYRVDIVRRQALAEMSVTIEPFDGNHDVDRICDQISRSLRDAFQMRVPVEAARPGELPRFEMKAKRWVVRDG